MRSAGATGVGVRSATGRGVGAATSGAATDAGVAAATASVLRIGVARAVPTGITPPQTEQRARTPVGGTFAGSTRKTL
jgi:hypothetical protein